LKKKWIRFKYDNVSFEGVLEYNEGELLSMLGQKIFEINIKKPLSYSISFTLGKEAHSIRMIFYVGASVEFDLILNMVLEEAIAYYFNKEKFVNLYDVIDKRLDEVNEKSKQLVKPLEEQIDKLRGALRKLRELRTLRVLTFREWKSKVNLVKDKIIQLQEQIINEQILLIKEVIKEEKEIRQLLFNFFDRSKLKIIEIKDVDE